LIQILPFRAYDSKLQVTRDFRLDFSEIFDFDTGSILVVAVEIAEKAMDLYAIDSHTQKVLGRKTIEIVGDVKDVQVKELSTDGQFVFLKVQEQKSSSSLVLDLSSFLPISNDSLIPQLPGLSYVTSLPHLMPAAPCQAELISATSERQSLGYETCD